MPGLWELILIGLVVATIVVPYFNKKKAANQIVEKKKNKKIYRAPDATEVDYDEE